MPEPRRCVYILRSLAAPTRYYTGVTSDLRARLADHNSALPAVPAGAAVIEP
jgi:predicted GIY-YIG superfamily endonuclease